MGGVTPGGYRGVRLPKPITEVHHHIINPDRTPALNPDGTPMIIIHRIKPIKQP
jgi:hypothetical protein